MPTDRKSMTLEQTGRFMHAGKADFTMINDSTGNELSFRVKKTRFDDETYSVEAKWSRRDSSWTYIGLLRNMYHRTTSKVELRQDSKEIVAFRWLLDRIRTNKPTQMRFVHNGKCCRCGKRLKDDESMARGIGPICAKLHGGYW